MGLLEPHGRHGRRDGEADLNAGAIMTMQTILGIGALIVLVSFIVFAFRQGMKVKNRPENVPPERISGGGL